MCPSPFGPQQVCRSPACHPARGGEAYRFMQVGAETLEVEDQEDQRAVHSAGGGLVRGAVMRMWFGCPQIFVGRYCREANVLLHLSAWACMGICEPHCQNIYIFCRIHMNVYTHVFRYVYIYMGYMRVCMCVYI